MNWGVVVLTAPRPMPTLDRTLASLARAGWRYALVACDDPPGGHFRAWTRALAAVRAVAPCADVYFVVEDDVVFCRDLRPYLEGCLWPDQPARIALCSVFTPAAYRQATPGWHQQRRGFHLVASQAWILPCETVTELLGEFQDVRSAHNADWMVGDWAQRTHRSVWYHTPSLAQHIGLGNSALGDNLISDLRVASDFVGEFAPPEQLIAR